MQYFKKDKDKLTCLLCSYYCKLKPNQTGICGVNKNTGDKIECLVYGHIGAINIDPIEKKPLYHFLPKSKSLSAFLFTSVTHKRLSENSCTSISTVVSAENSFLRVALYHSILCWSEDNLIL